MSARVLIFGAAGMLGHQLYRQLDRDFEVYGSIHGPLGTVSKYGFFDPNRLIYDVDAAKAEHVTAAVATIKPDVVVNCVGVVKSLEDAAGMAANIRLNALLPHLLHAACREHNARLIQISTDCVFAGTRGNYAETDTPDATDVYGKTKFLGEVSGEAALTLRTSFIGRELNTTRGLLEWFLANRGGQVKGYAKAVFSGLTTLEMARAVGMLIRDFPELSGVYHLAAAPIDKHRLLSKIRDAMKLDIEIKKDSGVKVNRSLDGRRFAQATGYRPLDWEDMIKELAADPARYDEWRTV
jgi:dTDP-4-dehydrorhamnose reductase